MRTIGRCWYVSRRPLPLLARPSLARAHEVPHVVGEHAVLDEHVALRGRAFVVDRVRAPLARVRAVVDQRDERRRDQLADAAAEHRRVLVDEVGLEPVAARLVEQHAAGAALRARPAASRAARAGRRSIVTRAARRDARDLLGVDLVEELEAERAARAPRCRSACRCRRPRRSCTTKRVRTWSSSTSRPSELATRTRRRESA